MPGIVSLSAPKESVTTFLKYALFHDRVCNSKLFFNEDLYILRYFL